MGSRKIERMLYVIGMVFTLGCAAWMIAGVAYIHLTTSVRVPVVQYVPIGLLVLSGVGFGLRIRFSRRIEREETSKSARYGQK
jgi:hypothetical protein